MNRELYQALQLGDSFFPIGVFSFSQALESFVQDKLVHDPATLADYLENLLEQVAWTDGIALLHACDAAACHDTAGLIEADREIRAFKLGKESRTMTAKTGRQLLRVGLNLWPAALAEANRLTT
ncbi:MAG: urease accessory protein UreF, partial [Firmicutes bacterium]|nr:urease accessory protein UreF [Bacillota bacterium]